LAVAADQGALILLGNGDGTFQSAVSYPNHPGQATSSVILADFNLDGNLDLAVGTLNGSPTANTALFYGNGDGTLQAPPLPINAHLKRGIRW
jgi:hypothetical protein